MSSVPDFDGQGQLGPAPRARYEINVSVVGISRAGKSSLVMSVGHAFRRSKNKFGVIAPRLPMAPIAKREFPVYIDATVNDMLEYRDKIWIGRRRWDFNTFDFRGGLISEILAGRGTPEAREILNRSDLIVLVLSPDEIANPDYLSQLLDGMTSLCDDVREAAEAEGRPAPMFVLALSKADDYGTAPGRNPRMVQTRPALDAQLALVGETEGPSRQARADQSWQRFIEAVGPDPTMRVLLSATRPLWERLGKRSRFFNVYLVAADPENLLWEDWERRGSLHLFADFFEYLSRRDGKIGPRLWIYATALATAVVVCAAGLTYRAAERQVEAVQVSLASGQAGTLPTHTGVGSGQVATFGPLEIERYLVAEHAAIGRQIGRRTGWPLPDYVARQLVLVNLQERYRRLAAMLERDKLTGFDPKKSEIPWLTDREVTAVAFGGDSIASQAAKAYEEDVKVLKDLADRHKNFAPVGEGDPFLRSLEALVVDNRAVAGGRFIALYRDGRREPTQFRPIVEKAVTRSLDKILIEGMRPAFVSVLRRRETDKSLAFLDKYYNPYTREGLVRLQLAPEHDYRFRFDEEAMKAKPVRAILTLARSAEGRSQIYEIDFWHRTVSVDGQPPLPLGEVPVPADVTFNGFTTARDGTAPPIRLTIAYHDQPDTLLFAAVLDGLQGAAPDLALRLTPVDAYLREDLQTCLGAVKFPEVDKKPFYKSDQKVATLLEGVNGDLRNAKENIKVRDERIASLSFDQISLRRMLVRVSVMNALSDLEREWRTRVPDTSVTSMPVAGLSLPDNAPKATKMMGLGALKVEIGSPYSDDAPEARKRFHIQRWLDVESLRTRWPGVSLTISEDVLKLITTGPMAHYHDGLEADLKVTFARRDLRAFHAKLTNLPLQGETPLETDLARAAATIKESLSSYQIRDGLDTIKNIVIAEKSSQKYHWVMHQAELLSEDLAGLKRFPEALINPPEERGIAWVDRPSWSNRLGVIREGPPEELIPPATPTPPTEKPKSLISIPGFISTPPATPTAPTEKGGP